MRWILSLAQLTHLSLHDEPSLGPLQDPSRPLSDPLAMSHDRQAMTGIIPISGRPVGCAVDYYPNTDRMKTTVQHSPQIALEGRPLHSNPNP